VAAGGGVRLYTHTQQGGGWGDTTPLLASLNAAAADMAGAASLQLQPAAATNPGIPPSSLMSFLRVKPSVAGVVLTEFDSAFSNPYYASRFDNATAGGFNSSGITAVAALVAAAVNRAAGGQAQQLQVRGAASQARPCSHCCPVAMINRLGDQWSWRPIVLGPLGLGISNNDACA
jgi:nicastrin